MKLKMVQFGFPSMRLPKKGRLVCNLVDLLIEEYSKRLFYTAMLKKNATTEATKAMVILWQPGIMYGNMLPFISNAVRGWK